MKIENEEQAQEALKALQTFYSQPVMPINRYCEALRTWQRVVEDRTMRLKEAEFPGISGPSYDNERTRKAYADYLAAKAAYNEHTSPVDKRYMAMSEIRSSEDLEEAISYTFMQITKSSLLGRLIYGGEKLRTEMCPIHKGHWSGLEWPDKPCLHRCQMTGWIQEAEDQGTPLRGPQVVTTGATCDVVDVDGTLLGKTKTQ